MSASYTISNTGTGAMNWTAGKTAAWLNLSSTGGTLAASASTSVTATINTAANSLAVGSYGDTITFTNTSNGTGNTTRVVSLAVLSAIQNWRQTWYATTSNSGSAADNADPYHTGLTNLAVFAFFGPNQNPATASVSQLPQAQRTGGYFYFSFAQPTGVSGITYGAEWCTKLEDGWLSVAESGSGSLHVFSVAIGIHTKIFMRLRVSSP